MFDFDTRSTAIKVERELDIAYGERRARLYALGLEEPPFHVELLSLLSSLNPFRLRRSRPAHVPEPAAVAEPEVPARDRSAAWRYCRNRASVRLRAGDRKVLFRVKG